ncbi:MAG TPA: response regulator, partial [Deltaproteobacteria bacterium]|nr:response regulator [Deltaproteobacteria bacterium]
METVLIVDDEKNYLILLEALLSDEGYEVIVTSSPQEALKIAENREIDLIITDMKMPGISGMDLMDRVHRRYPEIPVIMMTAYA